MTYNLLTEVELKKLYFIDSMNIKDIAEKYDVSKSTIQRRFRKFNIKPTRCSIDDYRKIVNDYEFGMTRKEIAEKYGVSYSFVNTQLRNIGYKKIVSDKLKDKSWLNYQLNNKHKNQKEIASELGVHPSAVLWWKNKHDIKVDKRFKNPKFHDKDYLIKLYKKYTLEQIAKLFDCDQTTVSNALKFHDIKRTNWKSTSSKEITIENFLKSYNIKFKRNVRYIISPFELDFYLPDFNVAIEVNGVYWHSEKFKDKNYHKKKYDMCKERGIFLLQFWDVDIETQENQVFSIIKHRLKLNTNRIFARKTIAKTIKKDISKEFLNKNHIHGSAQSNIEIGLYEGDMLVAVMTFKKRKIGIYELTRYATSCLVVGGFQKLLSYFIRNNDFNEIITFSDNMLFSGDVYIKSGFIQDEELLPDYKYILKNGLKVYDSGKKRWILKHG